MYDKLSAEVLTRIFDYLCPNQTIGSRAAFHNYLSFSLLNKSCRRVAQSAWFKHLVASSASQINKLCATLDNDQHLRRLAQAETSGLTSLAFLPEGGSDGGELRAGDVEAVVKRFPGVQVMHLSKLDARVLTFSLAVGLRSLRLHLVRLFLPHANSHGPEVWHLPNLQELDLHKVSLLNPDGEFLPTDRILAPLALPKLLLLAITWTEKHSDPSFPALAPQLVYLFLARSSATLPVRTSATTRVVEFVPRLPVPSPELRSCKHLRHLSLDIEGNTDLEALSSLPSRLKSLRLVSSASTAAERSVLTAKLKCLSKLKRLILEPSEASDGVARLATRIDCATRGVEVTEIKLEEDKFAAESDVARKWLTIVRNIGA